MPCKNGGDCKITVRLNWYLAYCLADGRDCKQTELKNPAEWEEYLIQSRSG